MIRIIREQNNDEIYDSRASEKETISQFMHMYSEYPPESLLNEYEHLLSDSAETLYGRRRHKLMMTALKKEIIGRMS